FLLTFPCLVVCHLFIMVPQAGEKFNKIFVSATVRCAEMEENMKKSATNEKYYIFIELKTQKPFVYKDFRVFTVDQVSKTGI
ncbi:MAG: hypothetical protein PHU33_17865, partial [Bacteroidales bacterium]|nr:hypothetical protein [Bacteroidales bacterium]